MQITGVCQTPDVTLIYAHRGASAYAPENTVPAFEKAWALGAVDVELDIQLSKDDVVVLYHDSTLAEKTGHQGKARDYYLFDGATPKGGQVFRAPGHADSLAVRVTAGRPCRPV